MIFKIGAGAFIGALYVAATIGAATALGFLLSFDLLEKSPNLGNKIVAFGFITILILILSGTIMLAGILLKCI